MRRPGSGRALVAGTLLAAALSGCAAPASMTGADVRRVAATAPAAAVADPADGLDGPEGMEGAGAVPATVGEPGFTVPDPGRLRGRLHRPDLLVLADRPLPGGTYARVARLPQVRAAATLALASVPVRDNLVTVAAADPAEYRRWTPGATARTDAVWQRVAEGDLALASDLAESVGGTLGGTVPLGNHATALGLRVGAHAGLSPRVGAVVNPLRGRQLGMVPDNALLVSARGDVSTAATAVRKIVGRRATVTPLADAAPTQGVHTAFLTGGSVAQAVGSFSYRWFADGTVQPDPAWVAANIRTEQVPILGTVTCHRVMLPQLRAALQEVVALGLAGSIDASDYGGCYVPRFIERNPSRGLSLHTWGIAVDLNVAGNLRGTVGEIDRRVVAVMKKWGFAWGGDWNYTDPMHFELAALVQAR